MFAQFLGVPMRKLRSIQPNGAASHLPNPNDDPSKTGFARCAWTNNAEKLSGAKSKRDVFQNQRLAAWRPSHDLFDAKNASWTGQGHPLWFDPDRVI